MKHRNNKGKNNENKNSIYTINSGKNMQALGKGAKVIEGRRLTGKVSEAELKDWVNQII